MSRVGVNLPQIIVSNTGSAASILANAFHDNPGRAVRPLAITGTNGKTTTAYLLRHLMGKVNVRCGMIGTVEIDDGRSRREASMTTPLSLIHISEPTRQAEISYAVFCLKKKKK